MRWFNISLESGRHIKISAPKYMDSTETEFFISAATQVAEQASESKVYEWWWSND